MKLALIGCGAMGQLVTSLARKGGDEIGVVFSSSNTGQTVEEFSAHLKDHDAAIDFSIADAVLKNVEACARARVPLVEGTTGWSQPDRAKQLVTEYDSALVYGANFSVGMNIFYRIVQTATDCFAKIDQYTPFIEEAHHSRKRDAPSGTALRLSELMLERYQRDIPIASTRAGYIPGTHRVGFDSEADQVLLTHAARSRQGFASGALLAAHWIVGRKGVFEFGEVIDQILMSNE
ncbi:MAG TPA: dihydrodipicolinate reductase C-terminal domain-containing protein [Pyrinomonadaceae bacterium]|nr:dihydrodipicolinate reductase C-terminal domain-containing protein [Pyrinomonadaceae bacterium]